MGPFVIDGSRRGSLSLCFQNNGRSLSLLCSLLLFFLEYFFSFCLRETGINASTDGVRVEGAVGFEMDGGFVNIVEMCVCWCRFADRTLQFFLVYLFL